MEGRSDVDRGRTAVGDTRIAPLSRYQEGKAVRSVAVVVDNEDAAADKSCRPDDLARPVGVRQIQHSRRAHRQSAGKLDVPGSKTDSYQVQLVDGHCHV